MKRAYALAACGAAGMVVLGGLSPAAATAAAAATSDSGAGRAVPAGFAPVSVTFVSNRRGWVLGSAPCGTHSCTTVLRTSDAGRSWRRISAPSASVLTATDRPGSVDQLRFADSRDGYADGVGLWITHDGGAKWTRKRSVAGIRHAVVSDLTVSGSSVYALISGTDPHYGGTDSHVRLVRATAASGRFHVVSDLGKDDQAGDLVASHGVVYFLNSRIGTKKGRLVRVVGSKLTRTRLPAEGCGNVAASTSTSVLLVCGQGVASGSMGNRVLYGSSDSGRGYRRLSSPGRGSGYDGSAVADAGNGHAVVTTAGSVSAALRSTGNGARSWHTSLSVKHAEFTELGFEDTRHGVVIADVGTAHRHTARLYRTSNAGKSWARISFR